MKTHVNRIFAKTGSRDRGQAVHYACQHGYADPARIAKPRIPVPNELPSRPGACGAAPGSGGDGERRLRR